ncbi:unnamed protein product [Durusdinium trenchii]|uniref:Uncharacterized protein n=1 Tax=Durusdinium trenchii TaxID=1381693 RepID=A0ABP0LB80_9DINO
MMRQSKHGVCLLALVALDAFPLQDNAGFVTRVENVLAHEALRQRVQLSAKPPSKEHLSGGEFNQQVTGSASVSEMLQVLHTERYNPNYNLIIVSAAWHTMARLQHSITRQVVADPYFDEFMQDTLQILKRSLVQDPGCWSRQSANLFWASAKLSRQSVVKRHLAKVQADFSEAAACTAFNMDEQGVANVIWACSELNLPRATLRKIMDAVTYRLRDVAEELKPQGTSNILLAAVRLGKEAPQLLDEMELLAEVLPDKIAAMDAQAVANSIWATTRLERQAGGAALLTVLPDLVRRAEVVVGNMNGQNVANIIWSAAKLRNRPPELLELMPRLTNRGGKIIGQLDSQNVANIFWATSKLQEEAPSLQYFLPNMTRRAEAVITQMDVEGSASTILAVGQLQSDDKLFLRNLLPGLTQRMFFILQHSPPREMSNACWGLALSGHADIDFMNSVAAELVARADQMKPKSVEYDMPQILISFARLGIPGPPDFLDIVHRKQRPMLKRMNAWGLCALSWSCKRLDDSGKFRDFCTMVNQQVATRGFSQQEVEYSRFGPEKWSQRPRKKRSK